MKIFLDDFCNKAVKKIDTKALDSEMYIYHLNHIAAAAAAKLLQSCLALCDPIDGSPPGSSVPGILQARILEWVANSFSILRITQIGGQVS